MIHSCVCTLIRVSGLIRDSLLRDSELFTQAVSVDAQCRDSFVWVLSFVARLSIQILPADAEMTWFIHFVWRNFLMWHSPIRDSLIHSDFTRRRWDASVGPHFTIVFVTLSFVTRFFIHVSSTHAEVPLWNPISLVYSWLPHSWLSHSWLSHLWLSYSFRSYLQRLRCLCGTPFHLFIRGSPICDFLIGDSPIGDSLIHSDPIRDFLIRDSHICDSLVHSGLICRHWGTSVGPPFRPGVYVYMLNNIIYIHMYIIYIYNIL